MIARLSTKFPSLRGGRAVPLAPPPIIGLGTGGGFSFVLQDTGGSTPQALSQVLRGLLVAANQDPKLSRVFSTYLRGHALDLSRYRPGQSAGPEGRSGQRLPGAAGHAGRLLCERHEPVRTHLAGSGSG